MSVLDRAHNKIKNLLFKLNRIYNHAVWAFFSPLLDLITYILLLKSRTNDKQVRSILHISALSHKPFMLSQLQSEQGFRARYLAITNGSNWLVGNRKNWDYVFSTRPSLAFIKPWKAIYLLIFVMRTFDAIHVHFTSYLTRDARELQYLKKWNKLIVFHFRGCDLRQGSLNKKMNPELNCCLECDYPIGTCETSDQYRKLNWAQKLADKKLVTTPDLVDFMPDALHVPFTAPFGIDLEKIVAHPKTNNVFRVVTSTNHPGIDGTRFVRAAVERLKNEGESIELLEVFRTPYLQALSIYKSADLYVGKLRMGYYTNSNIESMMLGIPNMCYIRPEFLSKIPECPIINAKPETVYNQIRFLVRNPHLLTSLKKQSQKFVLRNHSPHAVANILTKIYHTTV